MQRNPRQFCAVLLVATVALGCVVIPVPIPGREKVSSEVSGRVIDGKTKNPVPGAEVKVVGSRSSVGGQRPSTVADDDGRFHLPADKHFYLGTLATVDGGPHFPPTGEHSYTLSVSKSGYETLVVNLLDFLESRPDIGDVEIVTRQ